MKERAIVFFSGCLNKNSDYYKKIKYTDYDVYCADGGANHCYNIDKSIKPELIIGDLDSIENRVLDYYKEEGIKFEKYPEFKDFTDGELILEKLYKKYSEILVLGGLGGRTDHFLTNLNLLEKYQNVVYEDENEVLFFVKKNMTIKGKKDKIVSFIALTEVENLNLINFFYPLKNKNLKRASSLCNSNIISTGNAHISYSKGSIIGILQK